VYSALLLGFLLLGSSIGCGRSTARSPSDAPTPPAEAIRLEDRQAASGLDFRLDYTAGGEPGIKETIGHPAALLDADGDGRLEILLAGPNRVTLFRSAGSRRYESVPRAGFRQKGYWQGVAVGDVNRDGRPDVFLSGYGCAAFYLNQGGGQFRDLTTAYDLGNPSPDRWQTSAAFADVDRDGWLDLYVTCYVALGEKTGVCVYPGGIQTACAPTEFPPQRGTLYRSLGGRRFVDATAAFGLSGAHGNGLGVAFGDPNGDGYPDLYLANDQRPCDLYLNRGGRRFQNVGTRSGTAFGADGSPQAGMGVDFGDYDNDGREDLVVTTYQREPTSLYHNDGDDLFTNATFASHLGAPTSLAVGWGVKWVDLDNDGRLDLVIANGHPLHRIREIDPSVDSPQKLQVFRNEGGGRFREVTALGRGLPRAVSGRALCAGDLDNDGRVDLLISDIRGQPLLLRNTSPTLHHSLIVRLTAREVSEGAVVMLRAGDRKWMRRSSTGGSYLSASDGRVHFGLGSVERVDLLEVRWPSGRMSRRTALGVDREVFIEEPESGR
jgi:hypothetical protein